MHDFIITPETCPGCEELETLACAQRVRLRFSRETMHRIHESYKARLQLEQAQTPVYGQSTGFGPHVKFSAPNNRSGEHAAALLEHLAVGSGSPVAREIVRGAVILRVLTLSRGYSGVRPRVLRVYANLVRQKEHAFVPEIGSLGASGDLIPLSHIARSLFNHESRLKPEAREALALTNGTSFSAAMTAIAVSRTRRLLHLCESISGWLYAALSASSEALDPRLHRAGGHPLRAECAERIRKSGLDLRSPWEARALQEPYSVRCAPQVLGACHSNLEYARDVMAREIAGVDDNPLIFREGGRARVLHGGNFHGQQIAFAADALNQAQTQAGILLERQMDLLLDPARNGGAPLLLAPIPGRSGLAGLQLTATALVSEMRGRTGPYGNFSIPTNGGNQDIVPMAAQAARETYGQTRRLAELAACTAMSLAQLNHLRQTGIAPGPVTATPAWMPPFRGLHDDRALHDDLKRIADAFAEISPGSF